MLVTISLLFGTDMAAQKVSAADPFTADTTRIGTLLRKSEHHWALYQWDSAATAAGQALRLAVRAGTDPAHTTVPERERERVRLNARSLAYLGRVVRTGKEGEYLDEALRLFRSIGDRQGEADIALYRGEIGFEQGHFVEAIRHVQQAIRIHQADADTLEEAKCTNIAGEYYRIMGDPSTALTYHLAALPALMRSTDLSAIAWNHILIGAVHRATRNWPEALHYFNAAKFHYERTTDSIGMAIAYNDLGTAFFGKNALDSALYWHERARALRERLGSFDGMGHSMRYIAAIQMREGRYAEAVESLQKATRIFSEAGMTTSEARAMGAVADALLVMGDGPGALREMRPALDMLLRAPDRQYYPEMCYLLANIQRANDLVDDAIATLQKGIASALGANNHEACATGYRKLVELYRGTGDLRNAYAEHRNFLVARDSALAHADKAAVNRLMMRHDLEQDRMHIHAEDAVQRETRKLDLDAERQQKYVYIAGGSLFAVLALGLYGRLRFIARARRRMERQRKELERAKSRAERSEKFKERFLANMSHEIRTPMNAIMGITAILRRTEHLPEQQVPMDAIAYNADGLLRILNDILDMSKLDAGRLDLEAVPFAPLRVAAEVVEELQGKAQRKGLTLRSEAATAVPKALLGDPTRVRQVLFNLLDNAVKFTVQGEVVLTTTFEADARGGIVLEFAVRDTGPGIPADRLERIFDEFTKATSDGRRKYGGTGLGLAISKRLAELQQGALTVESSVGVGSTFTVRIPFERAQEPTPQGPVTSTRGELRDLRILLADDNAFNVMVAQEELQDAIPGARVDVATNGKEAVGLARVNSYDVILMDVQMPELNGYDAARAIRCLDGEKACVPILAMTANVIRSEVDRCLAAGMNGFVPKPFERKDLMEKLRSVLAYPEQA